MRFKKLKKGLLIGMSAVMIASAVTPNVAQAATWKQNRTGWWWEEDNGSYPVSEWKTIGGKRYYFDQSGYMKSGWYKEGSDWYYLGAANDGAMKTGWQKVNGTWYYLNEDGKMATGWKALGANTYYLDKSGAMHTGWLYEGSNWYYLGGANDGAMKTGWQSVGGKWYYMYDNGKMAANTWIGDWYVDGSGAWTKTKEPAKWIKSGNRWWYRHEDGGYTTNGFEKIGGQTYYFDAAGWMVTGWRQTNNKWYYFDASGAMKTNAWIGDYYVGADGVMATDTWIGEWYVDASGKWIPGKVKEPVKEPEKETEKEIALESISLDNTSLEIEKGDTKELTVQYNPDNTTVDRTVVWTTSDSSIATVTKGKVTAVAEGTAVITAKVGEVQAEYKITVVKEKIKLEYIYMNPGPGSCFVGEEGNRVLYGSPKEASLDGVEWISTNPEVMTIDQNGHYVAVGAGRTQMYAKIGDLETMKENIIVYESPELESIKFKYGSNYEISVGETFSITNGYYYDVKPEGEYIWIQLNDWKIESSDETVATVDYDFRGTASIKALKSGTSTITINVDGHEMSLLLTVVEKSYVIELKSPYYILSPGESIDYSKEIVFVPGKDVDLSTWEDPEINGTWTSLDTNVATVDKNGIVYAVSEGCAGILYVSSTGKVCECSVIVE